MILNYLVLSLLFNQPFLNKMNTTILIILIAVSTLILGFIIGNLFAKVTFKQQSANFEKEIATLQNKQANFEFQQQETRLRFDEKSKETEEIRREKEFLSVELATKNEALKNLQLKLL